MIIRPLVLLAIYTFFTGVDATDCYPGIQEFEAKVEVLNNTDKTDTVSVTCRIANLKSYGMVYYIKLFKKCKTDFEEIVNIRYIQGGNNEANFEEEWTDMEFKNISNVSGSTIVQAQNAKLLLQIDRRKLNCSYQCIWKCDISTLIISAPVCRTTQTSLKFSECESSGSNLCFRGASLLNIMILIYLYIYVC